MLCPNDDLKIQGDFNSEKGRLLQIVFEKCNNETISPQGSCHSNENITEFLRQRYIIIYMNQIRFATAEYDSNVIVPEGKLVWYQIESLKKSIITHKV